MSQATKRSFTKFGGESWKLNEKLISQI